LGSIKLKPDFIKSSVAAGLNPSISKVANIESGVTVTKYGIDGRILARNNINNRINQARTSIQRIESQLRQLQAVVNTSVDNYSAAESRLASKATAVATVGSQFTRQLTGGARAAWATDLRLAPEIGGTQAKEAAPSATTGAKEINTTNLTNSPVTATDQGNQSAPGHWKGDGYLLGDKQPSSAYGIEAGAGLGYYEYDWAGLSGFHNGHGQIGGSGKFSGINGQVNIDTNVIDMKNSLDMLSAGGTASVGGKSVLPLAKAEARVLNFESRTQLDGDIPVVGRLGVGGSADILKASAFAGFDNNSLGIGAKASMAEAEGGIYIPIPFTDHNIKLIGGVSAGGAGGEVKVGMETSLDIRVILGIKLGVAIEKQDD